MPTLTLAQQNAVASDRIVRRDFFWVAARDPDTDVDAPVGFWTDVGTVVVDGRTYYPGGVLGAGAVSYTSDGSIPALVIVLNGVSDAVRDLIRGETVAQVAITHSIGLFNPRTQELIGPLIQLFQGRIDDIDIKTAEEGGTSEIRLTCESEMRALTIKRYETRSQSSQAARDPDDDFFKYTDVIGQQKLYFGRRAPNRHRAQGKRKPGER